MIRTMECHQETHPTKSRSELPQAVIPVTPNQQRKEQVILERLTLTVEQESRKRMSQGDQVAILKNMQRQGKGTQVPLTSSGTVGRCYMRRISRRRQNNRAHAFKLLCRRCAETQTSPRWIFHTHDDADHPGNLQEAS